MSPSPYTPEQRDQALALYAEHGPAEAARRCGIKPGTIKSWARRAGAAPEAAANRATAVATAALTVQQRKLRTADAALDTADRVLEQMFAAVTEKKIVTIAGGLQHDGRWAVAEVERDRPTPQDQVRIATAFAILVDKVQILTGGATQRLGMEGGDSEVKAAAARVLELVRKPDHREAEAS